MKKKDKQHAFSLVAVLVFIPILLWLVFGWIEGRNTRSVRGEIPEDYGELARISYNGKTYVHRSNLTKVLVMGVDKDSDYETRGYRSGGQADFLLLVVIDHDNKKVMQLQIDRDTMTDITVLSILGEEVGTRVQQICLSHAFGKTEEDRCGYTKKAAENLLFGENIDLYAAVRLDSINEINDALGGVTVTLEDDFTVYDPNMAIGKKIKLQGNQAEIYVRSRYNIGEGTNEARQVRQKKFLSAAADLLYQKASENTDFIGEVYDKLGDALTTNISRGRMINEYVKAKDYTLLPAENLAGEYKLGDDGFMEFHADSDALLALVVGMFYQPE